MIIYQCDRCPNTEHFHYHVRGTVIRGNLDHRFTENGVLHGKWYPDEVNLCNECQKELKELIAGWWSRILEDAK